MAKKKSGNNTGLILTIVILALGVAAFCMAFLVGVKYLGLNDEVAYEFTGFQTMFGYTEKTTALGVTLSSEYLAFSFMATLAFALPLVGALVSLSGNKIAKLVGALLMIAGAVLLFLLPNFVVLATADGNLTVAAKLVDLCSGSTLGIGAILGGVFAGLGGLVSGYTALTTK